MMISSFYLAIVTATMARFRPDNRTPPPVNEMALTVADSLET